MSEAKGKVPAEVTSVTLTDGRTVDFVGKRQMLKEYGVDASGNVFARFDFRNGETRQLILAAALLATAAGHGVVQKVGDSAAGEKKVEDMVLAVEETIKQLEAGEWNVKREGGGFSGAGVVVRALCESTGKTPEQVKAFIDKKIADTGATRQAIYSSLRLSEKLKPIIARLEAESASKESKIDADAALAELETA